jgi:hypothetical protein
MIGEDLNNWEVALNPDIYQGHLVTALVDGFECRCLGLDG